MSEFNLTGLASGLDTRSIVEKMMELERKPLIKLQFRQDLAYARKAMLNDINSKLLSVSTANKALFDITQELWQTKLTDVSDSTKLTATANTSATAGSYQIDIQQVARSQVVGGKTVLLSQNLYDGTAAASSGTLLTNLKNSSAVSLGLLNTDIVKFSSYVGSTKVEGTFTVGTDITTLGDLANSIKNEINADTGGGWTGDVTIDAQGKLVIEGAPGNDEAVSSVSLNATDSANTAQRTYFNQAMAMSAQTIATGLADYTFKLRVGTQDDVAVTVASGDTLSSVASKINSATSLIKASVVDNRLLLTASNSGTENVITLTDNAAGLLGQLGLVPDGQGVVPFQAAGSAQEFQSAQDAKISINGSIVVRSSNVISDAITGVTLNLKTNNAPGSPVQLSVTSDTTAIKDKIKAFAEAYNSAIDFINTKLAETPIREPKSGDERLIGMFANDFQLRRVLREMRETLSRSVDGLNTSTDHLDDIGITVDRKGKITLNETTLNTALETKLSEVEALFSQRSTLNFNLPFASQVLYTNGGAKATTATLINSLYTQGGSHLGGADGQVITVAGTVNGESKSASLILGPTSNVQDLLDIVEAALGEGITASLDSYGRIKTTVPAGVNLGEMSITSSAAFMTQDLKSAGAYAIGANLLTSLTDVSGNTLELESGDQIQISGIVNGSYKAGTLSVTAATTLEDLRAKIEQVLGVASIVIENKGKLQISYPVGTSISDLSVKASSSSGGVSRDRFNQTMLSRDMNYIFEGFDLKESGYAVRLDQVIGSIADSTPTAGPYSDLSQRISNYQDEADRLQISIDTWNTRLASVEKRMLKQFEEMERALAKLQQQRNWLSQLPGLNLNSSQSQQSSSMLQ